MKKQQSYMSYERELEFYKAYSSNNTKEVSRIINTGLIDVNVFSENITCLMFASIAGFLDIAKIMINSGANKDIVNNHGNSALMFAAANGHTDIAKLLIKNGANIDIQNKEAKDTALIMAMKHGHISTIISMIEDGANIDIKNKNGKTIYDLAVSKKCIQLMIFINKSLVHHQDENGDTLLMKACQKKKESDILFLTNCGADFFLKNNNGESAFSILNKKRVLTSGLHSLVEKLILEQMISVDDSESLGL